MWAGGKHNEYNFNCLFISVPAISTVYYFKYFLVKLFVLSFGMLSLEILPAT